MIPRLHATALAALLAAVTTLCAVSVRAQVQQQQPSSDGQMRLHVQLPPQDTVDASQCPDAGSFVVIGPTARRGEPITAQAWNDCADLPRRSVPQPMIGVEIPVLAPQGRPRR
jgi:hypothetical protein